MTPQPDARWDFALSHAPQTRSLEHVRESLMAPAALLQSNPGPLDYSPLPEHLWSSLSVCNLDWDDEAAYSHLEWSYFRAGLGLLDSESAIGLSGGTPRLLDAFGSGVGAAGRTSVAHRFFDSHAFPGWEEGANAVVNSAVAIGQVVLLREIALSHSEAPSMIAAVASRMGMPQLLRDAIRHAPDKRATLMDTLWGLCCREAPYLNGCPFLPEEPLEHWCAAAIEHLPEAVHAWEDLVAELREPQDEAALRTIITKLESDPHTLLDPQSPWSALSDERARRILREHANIELVGRQVSAGETMQMP